LRKLGLGVEDEIGGRVPWNVAIKREKEGDGLKLVFEFQRSY